MAALAVPIVSFQILTSIRSDGKLKDCAKNDEFSPGASSGSPSPCQFYMLSYHHARMQAAARDFGWEIAMEVLDTVASVHGLEQSLHNHLYQEYSDYEYPEPLKVRILLSHEGLITIKSASTPAVPLENLFPLALTLPLTTVPASKDSTSTHFPPSWQFHLAPDPIPPSLFTRHKTTQREAYNLARLSLRAPEDGGMTSNAKEPIPEILLHGPEKHLSEASLSTPYLYRPSHISHTAEPGSDIAPRSNWVTPLMSSGGNQGTTRRWALEKGMLCVEGKVELQSLCDGEVIWVSNGVRGWGWGRVVL